MSSSYSAVGRDRAFDAGVVVEAVDRSVSVERGFDVVLDLGGFRDVGGDEQRVAALLAQDAGGGLARGGVAIDHDDLGAAAGETDRGGAADAVARAGDQGDLAFEIHGFLRCDR